jgi:hypothetical protein
MGYTLTPWRSWQKWHNDNRDFTLLSQPWFLANQELIGTKLLEIGAGSVAQVFATPLTIVKTTHSSPQLNLRYNCDQDVPIYDGNMVDQN